MTRTGHYQSPLQSDPGSMFVSQTDLQHISSSMTDDSEYSYPMTQAYIVKLKIITKHFYSVKQFALLLFYPVKLPRLVHRHAHTHARTHAHTHMHESTRTRMHTHACTRMHTHTHAHAHTQRLWHMLCY